MKRFMKFAGWFISVIVVLLLFTALYIQFAWNRASDRPVPLMVARRDSAAVAHGEYIFKYTWQCWTCHASTPVDADSPPGGGVVFDLRSVGPGFGLYYSRNLTPDTATGLGSWTDGEIVQSIREGVDRKRHTLFPLMPVEWLNGLSDDDALAIVAYLRSIPPVHNPIPDREPSFVAKALMTLNVIKASPEITKPVVAPAPGVTVEYGRYFASNMAGCADCHTPRNLQDGKFYLDSVFAGGSLLFGESEHHPLMSYARNIRPHEVDGIGRWTEDQFVVAVTTGITPAGTVLDPQMPYAHFKFIREDDLRGVYRFLMSLSPIPRKTPLPRNSERTREVQGASRGQLLFKARCQSCHGVDGKGAKPTGARLADLAASLTDKDLKDFVTEGQINLKMPPFSGTLTGDDMNDIIAYIRSWEKK